MRECSKSMAKFSNFIYKERRVSRDAKLPGVKKRKAVQLDSTHSNSLRSLHLFSREWLLVARFLLGSSRGGDGGIETVGDTRGPAGPGHVFLSICVLLTRLCSPSADSLICTPMK